LAPSAICGSAVQPIWCSISRTKFSMRAAAGDRLLALQRDQRVARLLVGEVDADRAARRSATTTMAMIGTTYL
jgi:hypothetical protein